jgi:hypothetical protein
MESSPWTNERLDDLAESMRTGFARVDQDVRDLRVEFREEIVGFRQEMRGGFGEVRGEINGVRGEVSGLRGEIGGLRGDINDLRTEFRTTMFRIGGGVIIGLIGVIATLLARGV